MVLQCYKTLYTTAVEFYKWTSDNKCIINARTMKPTNGNNAVQRNRVMNGNKKQKASVKIKIMAPKTQRHKRFMATLKNNLQQDLQTQHVEYKDEEQSLYSDLDDETILPENEQSDNWNSLLSSTVRPLMQLFAEESRFPNGSASSVPDEESLNSAKPQITYSDICLLSEDEDENTAQIPEKPLHSSSDSIGIFVWTPKSTNVFLELWEKHLTDIYSKRTNFHIHKEIAKEMSAYGATIREIKTKMDNMSRKYRVESVKVQSGSRSNWQYFKRVQTLLYGKPAEDFEEIMVGTAESSVHIKTDNSDSDNYVDELIEKITREATEEYKKNPVKEDEISIDEDEYQEEKKKEHSLPKSKPLKDEYASKTKVYTTDRMLQIEEEKLLIEKQKLQVMKHISRDLKSIGTALIELLRNTKK